MQNKSQYLGFQHNLIFHLHYGLFLVAMSNHLQSCHDSLIITYFNSTPSSFQDILDHSWCPVECSRLWRITKNSLHNEGIVAWHCLLIAGPLAGVLVGAPLLYSKFPSLKDDLLHRPYFMENQNNQLLLLRLLRTIRA